MDKEKDDKKIISIDLDEDDDNQDEDEDDDDIESDANHSNSENLQPESSSASTSNKIIKKKITRAVKEILTNNKTKFMSNFDPELSNRERRKLTRKFIAEGKKNGSIYDENGLLSGSEKDMCDCLIEECLGCHFPCPKCRSCKCGVECRVNRKWMYEAIENEAEITIIKNINIPAG